MPRIYYNSEPGDEPRTLTFGDEEFVWQPKGEVWEKIRVPNKTDFVDRRSGRPVTMMEYQWQKASDDGAPVSYLDISSQAWTWASRQIINRDKKLMPEHLYMKNRGEEDIDMQISYLQKLKNKISPPKKAAPVKKVQSANG